MNRKISPFSDLKSIFYLSRALIKNKPDIIHSYTPKAGMVCAISGYLCRIPIRIHTFTGLIFPYRKSFIRYILSIIDSLICKLNTHIIAEGQGVKKLLLDNNITHNKIHIIGNGNIAGVDTQYFNRLRIRGKKVVYQLRNKFKIENGTRTFIYAGRLSKEKGIIELLESFLKLNKKNIRLILIGEFESTEFEKLALKHINEDNHIYLVPWQSDIRPYLYIANCFTLPSYREGFPNVLLQASAMKLPSIVTDVPGSNEVIKHGYNGWICESQKATQLLDCMESFLSKNDDEIRGMGFNARENVVSKYEQAYYRKKLLGFYNKL